MRSKPVLHGRDHAIGGADEIPGLAAGGGTAKLLATWAGALPTALGNGLVWRVPFNSDGTTFTFTLTRAFARVESALTASISFRLEKSGGGDVPFSPTTITTITIPAGDYETENTGLTTTVTSGDLLRLVYTAVYLGTPNYHVELLGTE